MNTTNEIIILKPGQYVMASASLLHPVKILNFNKPTPAILLTSQGKSNDGRCECWEAYANGEIIITWLPPQLELKWTTP
jgi:hypothetical protein